MFVNLLLLFVVKPLTKPLFRVDKNLMFVHICDKNKDHHTTILPHVVMFQNVIAPPMVRTRRI